MPTMIVSVTRLRRRGIALTERELGSVEPVKGRLSFAFHGATGAPILTLHRLDSPQRPVKAIPSLRRPELVAIGADRLQFAGIESIRLDSGAVGEFAQAWLVQLSAEIFGRAGTSTT